MFINHYECPRCECCWSDRWSCTVDDDCPSSGLRHIAPDDIEDADDDDEEVLEGDPLTAGGSTE
jgi:hypothetical protein